MTSRLPIAFLLLFSAGAAFADDGIDRFEIVRESRQRVLPGLETAARCGTQAPPPEVAAQIERQTLALHETSAPTSQPPWIKTDSIAYPTTVKVNFHIIRSAAGVGDVSDATLDTQISVLNSAFQSRGFQFVRNSVDRVNNGSCHTLVFNSAQETSCKQAYINDIANNPDGVLNFYIADAVDGSGDPVAWGNFPWALSTHRVLDGVVVPYGTVPGGHLYPNNAGDIAVHEVGHWLGLYHTFQNSCSSPGDSVDDTPYEAESAVDECVNRDSCPQAGADPIHNYMAYTDDACVFELTTGQANRMVTHETTYRPALKQAQISGTGSIFAGKRLIDVYWKGMLVPTVDVFRDGVMVTSATANDGHHNQWFFGSASSYNYWVCNAGSTTWYDPATCSNVTTVYVQ